jgi:DNA-binding transcriptional LysR family regulator
MMDRLKAMETFVAVVDHGGFSAASRELRNSKAQVSRTISTLEDHLGVRQLQRSTRQSALTEEGRRYLQHARDLLEENIRVETELGQRRLVPKGRLKINGPSSWGERHLAPLLPGFMERYPEIELDVTLTDRFVDLLEEGYDVAVRVGGNSHSSLIGRQLGHIRSGIFASPDYLAKNPPLAVAADLENHRCLVYAVSGMARPWIFRGETITPRADLISNNGDVLRTAALQGSGVIALPTFFVEEDLAQGRLVDLASDWPDSDKDPNLTILAVYPERRHLPQKVRVFVDYLVKAMASE